MLLALSQPVDSCKHTIVSILKARFEHIPESLTETIENLEYSSGLEHLKKAIVSAKLEDFLKPLPNIDNSP
ncbi:MAG: hypothetical protein ACO3NK_01585 [Prochlorotrichaceae cyanobacterium]